MSEDTATANAGINTSDAKNTQTTAETKSTDRNNDQFRVQVKPQYLYTERPPILFQPKPVEPTTAGETLFNSINETNGKSKKRGQNKKRPRDAKISSDQKACLSVIRGEECPFQNCKFNHDLKEMLANRVEDLTEGEKGVEWLRGECPNWKLKG
jgi:hypothetical protein